LYLAGGKIYIIKVAGSVEVIREAVL